ncbi:hypothetical protein ACTXT7_009285 [Hymenolepis weldensis]
MIELAKQMKLRDFGFESKGFLKDKLRFMPPFLRPLWPDTFESICFFDGIWVTVAQYFGFQHERKQLNLGYNSLNFLPVDSPFRNDTKEKNY